MPSLSTTLPSGSEILMNTQMRYLTEHIDYP
jgi:hypothetical protein